MNQNQGRQGAERGKREGVRGRENKRMGEPNTGWLVVFAGTNDHFKTFHGFNLWFWNPYTCQLAQQLQAEQISRIAYKEEGKRKDGEK